MQGPHVCAIYVFYLCEAGDWMQGPHVCAFYVNDIYDTGGVGRHIVIAFGSPMRIRSIVGSQARRL